MKTSDVRPPAVAGMFYPAHPETLKHNVDKLISEASAKKVQGRVVALISPHAGYQYSGLTAAHGYKLLIGRTFETVVVVSPSHREYFGGISVYSGSAYQTPIGELQIDETTRNDLVKDDPIIEASAAGHRQEHAIEVQLPFLQMVVGNFKLLPVVMGDQRRDYCFHLGEKLALVLKEKNVLLVASTDLSHYYPSNVANKLDRIIIDDIEKFDYEQMMNDIESERSEACGGGPAVAVLLAAKLLGANRVSILHHCNSGDVTGDHSGVVGYLSAVVTCTN